jgi:hypothetical protein
MAVLVFEVVRDSFVLVNYLAPCPGAFGATAEG